MRRGVVLILGYASPPRVVSFTLRFAGTCRCRFVVRMNYEHGEHNYDRLVLSSAQDVLHVAVTIRPSGLSDPPLGGQDLPQKGTLSQWTA